MKEVESIRFRVVSPFLKGRGMEIGAGIAPQKMPAGVICETFDKRTRAELAEFFDVPQGETPAVHPMDSIGDRFPTGADFLIAHNVLEHCPDPISVLIGWQSMVKEGGRFVLSLPDMRFCSDRRRAKTSFEHLLLDYLLMRDERSFESREHVYSFICGWNDDGHYRGIDKAEMAARAHEQANAAKNDCHWHAFDFELGMKVILAAATFDSKTVALDAVAGPDEQGDTKTIGDLIYVYRILPGRRPPQPNCRWEEYVRDLEALREKLKRAVACLEMAMPPGLSGSRCP